MQCAFHVGKCFSIDCRWPDALEHLQPPRNEADAARSDKSNGDWPACHTSKKKRKWCFRLMTRTVIRSDVNPEPRMRRVGRAFPGQLLQKTMFQTWSLNIKTWTLRGNPEAPEMHWLTEQPRELTTVLDGHLISYLLYEAPAGHVEGFTVFPVSRKRVITQRSWCLFKRCKLHI